MTSAEIRTITLEDQSNEHHTVYIQKTPTYLVSPNCTLTCPYSSPKEIANGRRSSAPRPSKRTFSCRASSMKSRSATVSGFSLDIIITHRGSSPNRDKIRCVATLLQHSLCRQHSRWCGKLRRTFGGRYLSAVTFQPIIQRRSVPDIQLRRDCCGDRRSRF